MILAKQAPLDAADAQAREAAAGVEVPEGRVGRRLLAANFAEMA